MYNLVNKANSMHNFS